MLTTFLLTLVIGACTAWQTGVLRFAAAPILVIPMWLLLRLNTPMEGMRALTIRSTPGLTVMLSFFGAALLLMAVLFLIDVFVIGRFFGHPLQAYHAPVIAAAFIIVVVGVYWADRVVKADRLKQNSDDENATIA